ncbi:MAG: hypothetical protein ABIL68_02885 [bacterium]
MSAEWENYDGLKEFVFDRNGSLFGVAEIDPFKDRFLLSPSELRGLTHGISVGTALSRSVFEGIIDRPTLLYKWHYRQANNFLDGLAFLLTQYINAKGFRALPIPASQIVDWEAQKGCVSHRALAEAAGLGWRGKNNLLVNDMYGSQVRLVSVLTDMPLLTDRPVENGCGNCRRCVSACPASALGEEADAYDLKKCYDHLSVFSKMPGIGQHICGLCVKACPGKANMK